MIARLFAKPLPPHLRATVFAIACALCAPLAHAQDSTQFPRAAHLIARGDTIGTDDVAFDSTNTVATSQIIGLVARRVIQAGELLKAPAVGKAPLIALGQTVTVQAIVGNATISRQGIAQASAALGDSIHVRLDPRVTVTGIVSARATVTIR